MFKCISIHSFHLHIFLSVIYKKRVRFGHAPKLTSKYINIPFPPQFPPPPFPDGNVKILTAEKVWILSVVDFPALPSYLHLDENFPFCHVSLYPMQQPILPTFLSFPLTDPLVEMALLIVFLHLPFVDKVHQACFSTVPFAPAFSESHYPNVLNSMLQLTIIQMDVPTLLSLKSESLT